MKLKIEYICLFLVLLCLLVLSSVAYGSNLTQTNGGSGSTWQSLLNLLKDVPAFLENFWSYIWSALVWVFDALVWLMVQACVVLLTGMFSVVVAVVGALDLSVITTNSAAAWAGLNGNITAGIVALGIPQGLQIIGSCIIIRMIINLIPAEFTRV